MPNRFTYVFINLFKQIQCETIKLMHLPRDAQKTELATMLTTKRIKWRDKKTGAKQRQAVRVYERERWRV